MILYLNFLNMQKIQLNLSTTATLRTEERRWVGGGGDKEVAVVERIKQESMYGLLNNPYIDSCLFTGTKKWLLWRSGGHYIS